MSSQAVMMALEEKYKQILLENGITEQVESVKIEPVDTEGNNFSSICECVTVNFHSGEPLRFFSKRQLEKENEQEIVDEIKVYEKEHCFFSLLLPDMIQFAKERSPADAESLEKMIPKCYYADENLIVLEHLKFKGYGMLMGNVCHGNKHSRIALDRLARFHASSYALIQSLGQEGFEQKYPFVQYKNSWTKSGLRARGPWLEMVIDGALKILRAKGTHPTCEKALRYFEQYETDGFLKLTRHYYLDRSPSCTLVVNHGDYWNANILFKHDPHSSEPTDCVAIDWQTYHLGSPALDLQFYFFLVMDKSVRKDGGWMELLRFYYDKFQAYAGRLGQETTFTFEELVRDFRKKCETGFIMGMFNVFGITVLKVPLDTPDAPVPGEDGILDFLCKLMNYGLNRLMDEKGEEFSKGIIEAYEEFESVRLL